LRSFDKNRVVGVMILGQGADNSLGIPMVVMKRFSLDSLLAKSVVRQSTTTRLVIAILVTTLAPLTILSAVLASPNLSMSRQGLLCIVALVMAMSAVLGVLVARKFVRPIDELRTFMGNYIANGEIGDLPDDPSSEFGLLMRDVRNTVLRLDLASKELAEASRVDALTGLHNRRFSSQRLQQDLARATRSHTPVSLVAIDIDDFRRLNDQFGATVGDVCLKYFADVVKSSVREGDWIARWGGDEFLILLWDADSRQAEAVIHRIRRKLAQSTLTHEAGIRLSASFGYTAFAPGDKNYEVFAKADAALYKAKRLGRNQMVGPFGTTTTL
jgi:diguanylate cyclase (GGDEF)-like protein